MSDLIRREDVIAVLCFSQETGDMLCKDMRKVLEEIKAIPSAEQERKWIPVIEALPENNEEVLTTYIVNGNNRKRFVETASYIDGDEGYWSSHWDEYMVRGTRKDVLAWMPLPEVWRGE